MQDFHPPIDEYLSRIFELEEEGVPVIAARLSERLGKTPTSISEMLERLSAEGYINRSNRHIQLTPKGALIARNIVRRHRLAERLLLDVIGLPWHKIHLEASKWEHVISEEVEHLLVRLLKNPATCPHGNPIPQEGSASSVNTIWIPLSQAGISTRVILRRITEKVELDYDTLVYLDSNNFRPGSCALIVEKSPDQAFILKSESGQFVIGPSLAKELFVEIAN